MCPIKSTSPIKVFYNKNYLDEIQDTEFKRTIINFIKEFKMKEDEFTIIILMTMTKTIQSLKMEFSKKKHLR